MSAMLATKVTVEGGGRSTRIFGSTGDDKDWVPRDSGFIKNEGWNGVDEGLEGENLIYMGLKRFWGHFGAENSIKPYPEWFAMVDNWDGSAKLEPDRQWPSRGLKE